MTSNFLLCRKTYDFYNWSEKLKYVLFVISFSQTGNEEAGEEFDEDGVTKPPLTGIPQIDYVWDPNLPRELNGYESFSFLQ